MCLLPREDVGAIRCGCRSVGLSISLRLAGDAQAAGLQSHKEWLMKSQRGKGTRPGTLRRGRVCCSQAWVKPGGKEGKKGRGGWGTSQTPLPPPGCSGQPWQGLQCFSLGTSVPVSEKPKEEPLVVPWPCSLSQPEGSPL